MCVYALPTILESQFKGPKGSIRAETGCYRNQFIFTVTMTNPERDGKLIWLYQTTTQAQDFERKEAALIVSDQSNEQYKNVTLNPQVLLSWL